MRTPPYHNGSEGAPADWGGQWRPDAQGVSIDGTAPASTTGEHPTLTSVIGEFVGGRSWPGFARTKGPPEWGVAQLAERLAVNQEVGGSSPPAPVRCLSRGSDLRDIAVIGAGAAGTMAAIFAASAGTRVVLFERTRDGGRKILISGGGRCNVLPARLDEGRFVTDSSPNTLRRIVRSWPLAEQISFFERELSIGDCIPLARLSLSQYIDCMALLLGFRLFRLAFLSHAFQLLHDAFAEHLLHDLVSREFAHVLGEPVLLSALGGINHV